MHCIMTETTRNHCDAMFHHLREVLEEVLTALNQPNQSRSSSSTTTPAPQQSQPSRGHTSGISHLRPASTLGESDRAMSHKDIITISTLFATLAKKATGFMKDGTITEAILRGIYQESLQATLAVKNCRERADRDGEE